MGVLLLNSLIKRFVPTSFREIACVTQLDVRQNLVFGVLGLRLSSVLCLAKLWQWSLSLRTTREVSGTIHLHQIYHAEMFLNMVLSLQNRTIFSAWFLHLPDNLMSCNDIPVFTASGKAHNYVPDCSSSYFSISVQSADGLKERKQVRRPKVLHIAMLSSLFL